MWIHSLQGRLWPLWFENFVYMWWVVNKKHIKFYFVSISISILLCVQCAFEHSLNGWLDELVLKTYERMLFIFYFRFLFGMNDPIQSWRACGAKKKTKTWNIQKNVCAGREPLEIIHAVIELQNMMLFQHSWKKNVKTIKTWEPQCKLWNINWALCRHAKAIVSARICKASLKQRPTLLQYMQFMTSRHFVKFPEVICCYFNTKTKASMVPLIATHGCLLWNFHL